MKYTYSGNPKRPSFKVTRALVERAHGVAMAWRFAATTIPNTIQSANAYADLANQIELLERAANASEEEI